MDRQNLKKILFLKDSRIIIRSAKEDDLSFVTRIHQEAFPTSLMTLFGPKFLWLYYEKVLQFPGKIFLVAQDSPGGDIVGFAAGFCNPALFYSYLGKSKIKIGWTIFQGVLLKPERWGKLVQAWSSYRSATNVSLESQVNGAASAELASVAVSPSFQGKGAGALLVRHFVATAFCRGCRRVYLTTDALENDRVNAFYQRLGFLLTKSIRKGHNRLMNLYVIEPVSACDDA